MITIPNLVLGTEPARRRLGALGDTDDPLVELERLRRREAELARAVAAIHREPRSVLRAKRERVPLHRVRRADLRTLRTALREPAALAALFRTRPVETAGFSSSRPFLDTPAAERSLDSPANRAALFMLRALRRRAGGVRDRLREAAEKEGEPGARSGIRARLPAMGGDPERDDPAVRTRREEIAFPGGTPPRDHRRWAERGCRTPGVRAVLAGGVGRRFGTASIATPRTTYRSARPGRSTSAGASWSWPRRIREWLPEPEWQESAGTGSQ